MLIRQLTVFVENRQGAMAEVTGELASHNVDLRALSMADTQEFGVLRLMVKDVDAALAVLREAGHSVNVTPVLAVKISDTPGRVAQAVSPPPMTIMVSGDMPIASSTGWVRVPTTSVDLTSGGSLLISMPKSQD